MTDRLSDTDLAAPTATSNASNAAADWLDFSQPWRAEITKVGIGYSIRVTNGVMERYDRPWALTLRGARRVGRRRVRLLRHEIRPIEIIVTEEPAPICEAPRLQRGMAH